MSLRFTLFSVILTTIFVFSFEVSHKNIKNLFNTISPNTLFVGQQVHFLPTCHSTNDIGLDMLSHSDVFEGTVIITDEQTAGKGQRGNTWEAEPGKNLTLSIILKPDFLQIKDQFFLNIITSLAVHDTLTHFIKKKIKIKWPNDIYCKEKKICGILIQNVLKKNLIYGSIVGIGLNVNQKTFKESKAISMALANECEFDLQSVVVKLLESLEKFFLLLKNGSRQTLKEKYLHELMWVNEERYFKSDFLFKGIIRDVDEGGRLVLEVGSDKKCFSLKEITFMH